MVQLHREALGMVSGRMGGPDKSAETAVRAADIFRESVSPFEAAYGAFGEDHPPLGDSGQRYRDLVKVVPEVIFTLSADGRVTSLNPAFERVTGWAREEVLGQPVACYVYPEDFPFAQEMFRRLLKRQAPPTFELRLRSKSGEYMIKEIAATPEVRDGEVVGVVGIARDITKRREAEEALRGLFEGVPVGLGRTTAGGQILDANPALVQMLGYPDRESLLEANAADFYVDPKDRLRWMALMERWGVVQNFEMHLRRRDGTTFWARNSARAVWDAGGKVLHYEGAVEDISDRKLAEMARRRLNEKLEEEARRIAHALHDEAGQLLTSIHLALDAAARDLPPATRERLRGVQELLKQTEEQLRRLSHELRPTVLDDLGLVPALEFLAKGASTRTGIQIAVGGNGNGRLPPSIEIALYRIAQEALTNVARHAHATHVWVEVHHADPLVRCSICDDGIGFDVTDALARRGERGIGLPGMRERAEALGGTLQIVSAPGRGTDILVTMPLEKLER
jgi:PAS domain S-box-containing protein